MEDKKNALLFTTHDSMNGVKDDPLKAWLPLTPMYKRPLQRSASCSTLSLCESEPILANFDMSRLRLHKEYGSLPKKNNNRPWKDSVLYWFLTVLCYMLCLANLSCGFQHLASGILEASRGRVDYFSILADACFEIVTIVMFSGLHSTTIRTFPFTNVVYTLCITCDLFSLFTAALLLYSSHDWLIFIVLVNNISFMLAFSLLKVLHSTQGPTATPTPTTITPASTPTSTSSTST
ncbi:hypothetical protein Ahia01_000608700 [Argonauta hians]